MIKKIFLIIFISLFVTSCWSDDETPEKAKVWLINTETKSMSISVPSNWSIIENKSELLPKAKDSKIELAVRANSPVNWFSNNLLILSDDITKYITSKEFSILNNIGAETDYLDYTELEAKSFKFLDEEESMLYVFEAKYNVDTPKLKFLQTAHICNQNKAFFFTIAIPKSTKDTTKYEKLIATFKCK